MSSCFPLRECRDLEPFLTPGGTYTSVILRMHDLGVLIIPLEGTATRAPFIPVSHQPVLSKGPKQRTTSGYFSSGWLCVFVCVCVCVWREPDGQGAKEDEEQAEAGAEEGPAGGGEEDRREGETAEEPEEEERG